MRALAATRASGKLIFIVEAVEFVWLNHSRLIVKSKMYGDVGGGGWLVVSGV